MEKKKVATESSMSLPPYVVYADDSVYSVMDLTDQTTPGPIDAPTALLVPLREVNSLIATGDYWNVSGVTCYALRPEDLDRLLDSEDDAWVPAHHWHEAWRIGEKLQRWNAREEVPATSSGADQP